MKKVKAQCQGFNEGQLAVFFRLKAMLQLFMIRHTKKDISQLNQLKPSFKRTSTIMSKSEVLACELKNEDILVLNIRMNKNDHIHLFDRQYINLGCSDEYCRYINDRENVRIPGFALKS
jgi:hypothetical protein